MVTFGNNSVGVSDLQSLFSHLGQDQIMGFVSDQSSYYPFITSGYGLPRQARIFSSHIDLKSLRVSAWVWCCFSWTKCESQKSTTKNLLPPRWPIWAAGSFHDRSGASQLRIGSRWSRGQNLTWLRACPASTTSMRAAQTLHSPTQKRSLIFLAVKSQQFYTIAERRRPVPVVGSHDFCKRRSKTTLVQKINSKKSEKLYRKFTCIKIPQI